MHWDNDSTSQNNKILILIMAAYVMSPGIFSSEAIAQSQLSTQADTTVSSNKTKSTTRKIIRLGTAIPPNKGNKSINISSTDAGPILPYYSHSGCINCGVVEQPQFDHGYNMHAITGGIIGGTIANKIHKRFNPAPRLRIKKSSNHHIGNIEHQNQQPIMMDKNPLSLP